jgi:hypothetical protein
VKNWERIPAVAFEGASLPGQTCPNKKETFFQNLHLKLNLLLHLVEGRECYRIQQEGSNATDRTTTRLRAL